MEYGSPELMKNWMDLEAYKKHQHEVFVGEGEWVSEKKSLDRLRPSMSTLQGKKDLIGVEAGVGSCIHAQTLYEHLDIKKLYLLDLNDPPVEPGVSLIKNDNVVFLKGNSIHVLEQIEEELDFAYLDSSHEFMHLVNEIKAVYPKLKEGGLLAGHDYEHIGVSAAVNTLMFNIWKHTKEKPDSFFFDACRDKHPGYPREYIERGFPVDWWHIKKHNLPNDFSINLLRNG